MSLIHKLVSSLEYIWLHNRLKTNHSELWLPAWDCAEPLLVSSFPLLLCSFVPAVNYMTQEIIQNGSISNSFLSCEIHLKIQLPMWIPSFECFLKLFLTLFCGHVAFLSWLTSTISVLCLQQNFFMNYYHKLWFVSIKERKVNKTLSLG